MRELSFHLWQEAPQIKFRVLQDRQTAMALRTTLNVSLTPELARLVADRVASGRYGSASEVVRAALRLLERVGEPLPESAAPRERSRGTRRSAEGSRV